MLICGGDECEFIDNDEDPGELPLLLSLFHPVGSRFFAQLESSFIKSYSLCSRPCRKTLARQHQNLIAYNTRLIFLDVPGLTFRVSGEESAGGGACGLV